MDRESVNKVIKRLRATYPNAYKGFDRDTFIALADSIEKAFGKFPNLVVENEYERWCNEEKFPPTISDIAPRVYATIPNGNRDSINDPATWQTYVDEKGYEFTIPPKGSRCYEYLYGGQK